MEAKTAAGPRWSTSAAWRHGLKLNLADPEFLLQPPQGCCRSVSQKGTVTGQGGGGAMVKSDIWPGVSNSVLFPPQP